MGKGSLLHLLRSLVASGLPPPSTADATFPRTLSPPDVAPDVAFGLAFPAAVAVVSPCRMEADYMNAPSGAPARGPLVGAAGTFALALAVVAEVRTA